jgi:hypothetical protein
MATSMKLVDAIASAGLRDARAGTAVKRFGTVTAAPSGGLVTVTVGGASVSCNYLRGLALSVGDWVCVLVDGDAWVVLGAVGKVSDTGRDLGYTVQATAPTFATSGWTDFTTAQWNPITFTMPSSGRVIVNVSAYVGNTGSGAYVGCGYRMTPTSAVTVMGSGGGSVAGYACIVRASKVSICNGTPGVAYTCVPQWYCSSQTATAYCNEGVIHITAGG